MKRTLFLLFWTVTSCEFMQVTPYDGRALSRAPATIYASAIAYPDDYDWRKDSLGGSVNTEILFFKDGRESFRMAAGEANAVGKDADMHHIFDRHLYSDFSTATETIIRKDGDEIFRFAGRERIVDLFVKDSSVFTLGELRSGKGWTFRRDGLPVLAKERGALMGGLYMDRNELCFAYLEELAGSGNSLGRTYWFVHEGKVEQLTYSSDIEEVYAIRRMDGNINYIARSSMQQYLVWKDNAKTTLIGCSKSEQSRNMEFVSGGGQLMAHAQRWINSKMTLDWNDYYWSRTSLLSNTSSAEQTCAFCRENAMFCYAHSPYSNTFPVTVIWNGRNYRMPSSLLLVSSRALTCDESDFHIGMNDMSRCCQPVIVSRYDTSRFSFNGYFIELSLP